MGWTILLAILIGVLAAAGACIAGFLVWAWWWMRTSPHLPEASRLRDVVKTNAQYGGESSATALRAFDELVELARRYPSEPLLHANAFLAACDLMLEIPHKLTGEWVEGLIAYAERVIDQRPDRRITRPLAELLRALGVSLAHAPVARELYERLGAMRRLPQHIWPPPVYDPPVRPAPYRR